MDRDGFSRRLKTVLLIAVFLVAAGGLIALISLRGAGDGDHTPVLAEASAPQDAVAQAPAAAQEPGRRSGRAAPVAPPAANDRGRALLTEAEAHLSAGKLLEARETLFTLLDESHDAAARQRARNHLNTIHTELVFNPHPMPEKEEYVVQSGDSLGRIARRYGTTVELLQKSNRISGHIIHPGQRLRVLKEKFSIAVSIEDNTLTLYLNGRYFKRYPVGTGAYGKTPTGESKVTDRIAQPTWWRPDGTSIPYGDKDNLLGTHWLALDIPRYGIHGTWEPDTIGGYESAGCIRMYNHDVEELFNLIPVGTPVVLR